MSSGITFGAARAILATVVENGSSPLDPRVKTRTDEAQQIILNVLIPVNGMQTVDVMATGTTLLLPKEMESAYEVEVRGGATVFDQTDVTQGWSMVNQFAYVDPSSAHDNPLVDQFLQPDPTDDTILRRQYDYPGLQSGATVRVTGPKRWLPIENDSTFLIVQNVPALKLMIQSIEATENNDHQGAQAFRQACMEILQAEIKKHQLDPVNFLKRKSGYDSDLATLHPHTFGYFRARLALELPQGQMLGKSELTRLLEEAERGLMDKILAVGMIQEYTASVTEEFTILCPKEVEAILAVSVCGQPLYIKSIFQKYAKQGRWWMGGCCCEELRDEGEVRDVNGDLRRAYSLNLVGQDNTDVRDMKFLAVLRWAKKAPTDYMVIKNFEAIRLKCSSILKQKEEKYQESIADEQLAIEQLDKEIRRYLGGQLVIAPTNFGIWSTRRYRGWWR